MAEDTNTVETVVARAEALAFDLAMSTVHEWKQRTQGKVLGFLPMYVPREIAHAAGMLPIALFGGGDRLEIIRGDAYFQSYICHIPRSVIELLLNGRYDVVDGFLFPSICDVIRNLSGMWQMLAPEKYCRYVDVPQNFKPELGGKFYRAQLVELATDLAKLSGSTVSDDALQRSIVVYNENRRAIRELQTLQREQPWVVPVSEAFVLVRAGAMLSVDAHTSLIHDYLAAARAADRREMDLARVVVRGSFCEQPPLALVRTLERAGCYVVDDDFALGLRWIEGDIAESGDPFDALVTAFLEMSPASAAKYIDEEEKGRRLIDTVKQSHAEGVVFCAPSFCDPALLDQPMLAAALDREGIDHTAFKYSENTGQFAVIREQAGTFADSIKLWATA